jgi:hypothetical protein
MAFRAPFPFNDGARLLFSIGLRERIENFVPFVISNMTRSTPRYLALLEDLRTIFDSANTEDVTVGVLCPAATDADLAALDVLMEKMLGCRLPLSYRIFLGHTNGAGTQGSVLFGTDNASEPKPAEWEKKGVVYASLTWLHDPRKSDWIIVGENEFEVFAISRDDRRFAVLAGGTEEMIREMSSMDDLLCDCLDQMRQANAHNIHSGASGERGPGAV